MHPELKLVPDDEWFSELKADGIQAAYMDWGILPGGYFNGPTQAIKSTLKTWRAAVFASGWQRKLLKHEYGHAIDFPLNAHPTTFWAGMRHAASVGFDERAYTRFLRWTSNPDLEKVFMVWFEAKQVEAKM